MDWTEQEKLALEILKDPAAEEQQWLAAAEQVAGNRPVTSLSPRAHPLYSPVILVGAFVSGAASIAGGALLAVGLISLVLTLSGYLGFSSSPTAGFLCIVAISMVLGFMLGISRRAPLEHEGFRIGLLTPLFGAFALMNMFCLAPISSMLGPWIICMPMLSLFVALRAYQFGCRSLDNLMREQKRSLTQTAENNHERFFSPTCTSHAAISMARSTTNLESKTNNFGSETLKIEPEKLQIESEPIALEAEKPKRKSRKRPPPIEPMG